MPGGNQTLTASSFEDMACLTALGEHEVVRERKNRLFRMRWSGSFWKMKLPMGSSQPMNASADTSATSSVLVDGTSYDIATSNVSAG
jgi:hypothetical protein